MLDILNSAHISFLFCSGKKILHLTFYLYLIIYKEITLTTLTRVSTSHLPPPLQHLVFSLDDSNTCIPTPLPPPPTPRNVVFTLEKKHL